MYAKVHWIFQNPPRKTQSHQILAVLWGNRHQNSDFLGESVFSVQHYGTVSEKTLFESKNLIYTHNSGMAKVRIILVVLLFLCAVSVAAKPKTQTTPLASTKLERKYRYNTCVPFLFVQNRLK